MGKRWPVLIAFAAGLGAGLFLYWQDRQRAANLSAELGREKQLVLELRGKLAVAEQDRLAESAAPPEPAGIAPPTPVSRPKVQAPDDPVTRAELVRMLDEKSQKLSAAEAALAELREKLLTAESRAADVLTQREQMAAELSEIRERLEASTRLTQALQSEAQSRNSRVAQVEEGNRELRRKSEEASQKLTRLDALVTEMEDVGRRRESYITDILRRYREATDQFRAFTLRVDASTDPANPGGNYLSRIQSAIAQADEDLRQLRTLNTRAGQLQKQLATLRR